ncbi:MAG: DUF2283 domain-containing protein [Proteobacteria bacterium]|jgi:uncharacterized protein YuzE|nr:DUF2283 domain-containing protein [Pseudomonadota bacterium]
MKITYDKDADALYIRFIEGDFQCRVVRISDDVAADFAENDRLVGIEVLGAHRLFSEPDKPAIDLRDILPRVVAA